MPGRWLLLCLCWVVLSGCARTTVVLLPDEEGHVGGALITPANGKEVALSSAGQAVSMDAAQAVNTDGNTVRQRLGAALAAFPAAPSSRIVYFARESTVPLSRSNATLEATVEDFRSRRVPQLLVIGHTDSTGESDFNNQLSRRRAEAVAAWLMRQGIPREAIQLQSFGSQEPLVPAQEGVPEPRNRRVELFVW